jgi:hypothetical protein
MVDTDFCAARHQPTFSRFASNLERGNFFFEHGGLAAKRGVVEEGHTPANLFFEQELTPECRKSGGRILKGCFQRTTMLDTDFCAARHHTIFSRSASSLERGNFFLKNGGLAATDGAVEEGHTQKILFFAPRHRPPFPISLSPPAPRRYARVAPADFAKLERGGGGACGALPSPFFSSFSLTRAFGAPPPSPFLLLVYTSTGYGGGG